MVTWVTDLYPGGSKQVEDGDDFSFMQAPCKLVLHTTETTDFPDYPRNKAPHVTANFHKRQWRQHRTLDKPSWALAGTSGTNSMGAIQVEIVAYAASLKDISQNDLNWLAGLLRMLLTQTGVPIQASVTFGGPETYGINGAKRLSISAWNSYRGILGHQHVRAPNVHWDPGAIDINQWLAAIKSESQPNPPEDNVAVVTGIRNAGRFAVYNETIGWRLLTSQLDLDTYTAIGNVLGMKVTTVDVDSSGWIMAENCFKIPAIIFPPPSPADVDEAAIADAVAKAITPLLVASNGDVSAESIANIVNEIKKITYSSKAN